MNQTDTKILLVGPSNDIKNLTEQNILNYKKEGYKIFVYGEAIKLFSNFTSNAKNIDYYTFVDPFSIHKQYENIFKKNILSKAKVIVPDSLGVSPNKLSTNCLDNCA